MTVIVLDKTDAQQENDITYDGLSASEYWRYCALYDAKHDYYGTFDPYTFNSLGDELDREYWMLTEKKRKHEKEERRREKEEQRREAAETITRFERAYKFVENAMHEEAAGKDEDSLYVRQIMWMAGRKACLLASHDINEIPHEECIKVITKAVHAQENYYAYCAYLAIAVWLITDEIYKYNHKGDLTDIRMTVNQVLEIANSMFYDGKYKFGEDTSW